jgi:hypothetical protein
MTAAKRDYSKPKLVPSMYHGDGKHIRLTMIDVQRLLADEPTIADFNDLRTKNLLPKLQKRFSEYLRKGGQVSTAECAFWMLETSETFQKIKGASCIPFLQCLR